MARLSRAKTQDRNREKLLAAARELFLRDGYRATSLSGVADRAGFSTGAVYSNFSGKAELATLVLRDLHHQQFSDLRAIMDPGAAPATIASGVLAWGERALSSGWPRLELEFTLDGRADERVVAAAAARQQEGVDALARVLAGLLPAEVAETLSLRAVADGLINLAIGVAVRRQIDPTVSLAPFELLLRGALGPAQERSATS